MLSTKQRSEWATKIQKLNDNVSRKNFQEIKTEDKDSFSTNFSYGSLESVNKSLRVCFGSSKDLGIAIHGMYFKVSNQKEMQVSFRYLLSSILVYKKSFLIAIIID